MSTETTMEAVSQAMRESVKVAADYAHSKARGPYDTIPYPGRDKASAAEIERVLTAAQLASDKRERDFYEELYAAWGGDPTDLAWRKDEAAAEKRRLAAAKRAEQTAAAS